MKNNIDIIRNKFQFNYVEPVKFEEKPGFKWVPYGRSTNEFARDLIKYSKESELHGAILNTKVKMISGEKVIVNSEATKEFLKTINPTDTIENLVYKIAYDLELFGSFCLNTIWNRKHDKINELYHISADKILYGKLNEKNQIENYYYSRDWSKYRQKDYQPIEIPAFKTSNQGSELLVVIPSYQPGVDYYTYPDYIAALKAIETDIEIMNFHNSNLQNNFQPGKIISFITDEPSEEEKQAIREMFEEKHSGTDNAGRTIINYCSDKDSAPIISTLSSDGMDEMFIQLSNDIRSRILTGHGVTSPLLVGITTPGQLGGSNELSVARDLFYKYRILPKREVIIDTINKILEINGLEGISIEDNEDVEVKTEKTTNMNKHKGCNCGCEDGEIKVNFSGEISEEEKEMIKLGKEIKIWKCKFNEDTCEWCKELDGVTAEVGKPFTKTSKSNGKTYKMMGPADNHKGCNCEIEYE